MNHGHSKITICVLNIKKQHLFQAYFDCFQLSYSCDKTKARNIRKSAPPPHAIV